MYVIHICWRMDGEPYAMAGMTSSRFTGPARHLAQRPGCRRDPLLGRSVEAVGAPLSCLRQAAWQPYQRTALSECLLTAHADFVRERAAAVHHSAQILYQELRQQRGYTGSYATVRRFVRPLREAACRADLTWTRFETPPGQQSQIDWGQGSPRRCSQVMRLLAGRTAGRTVRPVCERCGFHERPSTRRVWARS